MLIAEFPTVIAAKRKLKDMMYKGMKAQAQGSFSDVGQLPLNALFHSYDILFLNLPPLTYLL